MKKTEAMQILAGGHTIKSTVNGYNITIYPETISENILCNEGVLDMYLIQDFVENETGDLIQGYCLDDVVIDI
jgi:hypothetical protein